MQSPIFIFSLPRSGSTLLQRVLMSNKNIASVSEPWLLLPQIYLLKKRGTISEYSSLTSYRGIKGFISNLPNKEQDYNKSLHDFIISLYKNQCKNDERYFLDKTPRYYLIIDEIVELFPNAKFIFLFRNPIHIYASIINTWGNNKFNKRYKNYYDIANGFEMLSQGYVKHRQISISINYEEFVLNPEKNLNIISKYLDLQIGFNALKDFKDQNTKGDLGDPTGIYLYNNLAPEVLSKWKTTFNSFLRKKIALRMLNKIEEDTFKIQHYNKSDIIKQVKNLNNKKDKFFFLDLLDLILSKIIRKWHLNLLNKNYKWLKGKHIS